ncbi:uncharacterized protein PG998_009228 [Apiospora kogelbergensis]|uniref:Uncharacterized protein n=1 Tax=Apiospora kogelbergensis TaxID=1337665 RepID=A0AAW0R741_9PEZI
MSRPQVHTSLGRLAFVAFAILSSPAAAVCTKWETIDTSQESTTQDFSTPGHLTDLEWLACPHDSQSPCSFASKAYHITAQPDVRSGGREGGSVLMGSLRPEETTAILKLAQHAYNEAMNADKYHPRESVEFKSLDATVDPFIHSVTEAPPGLQTVPPGKNVTLEWHSFYRYATGVLGGCTNTTLNGLRVTAGAPYTTTDTRTYKESIAGAWTRSITEFE